MFQLALPLLFNCRSRRFHCCMSHICCMLHACCMLLHVAYIACLHGVMRSNKASLYLAHWTPRFRRAVILDVFQILLLFILFGAISDWVLLKQKQGIQYGLSEGRRIPWRANENSELKQANCPKRKKTRVTNSEWGLVLHLITWESQAIRCWCTNHRVRKQDLYNPVEFLITFHT